MTEVSFAVADVELQQVKPAEHAYHEYLARAIPGLNKKPTFGNTPKSDPNSGPKLLKATQPEFPYTQTRFSNGFVGAAFQAYSQHHYLIISPDDVWIAITTALSRYINANAEGMRELFVNHSGQKELVITDVGTINSVNWDALIAKMSGLIAQNTNGDIQKWIEPDFSTTTKEIHTVGSIVLMGAMQKYFSYKFELCCGLPGVTMKGTLADWQAIRQKVDRLLEFKQSVLADWHKLLVPILDEFINSYSGNVDKDFWNRIAHQKGGGSGPRYLSGWILAFIPFDDKDNYILREWEQVQENNCYGRVNVNDVPTSAVSVPVVIDDNGHLHNTTFYAGHLFATQGSTPNSIQPYLGWVMFED
jgi:hypothetical protein